MLVCSDPALPCTVLVSVTTPENVLLPVKVLAAPNCAFPATLPTTFDPLMVALIKGGTNVSNGLPKSPTEKFAPAVKYLIVMICAVPDNASEILVAWLVTPIGPQFCES